MDTPMTDRRVHPLRSLRTQLLGGAVILLCLSVAAVGYFLILHQEHILTDEMQKTIILQGRNIAQSAEKSLLHADPEFELYPLVTRLIEDNRRITSITIVDANGRIQGNEDLVMISKSFTPDLAPYAPAAAAFLRPDESLFQNSDEYLLATPVVSTDRAVGTVYLTYSKADLHAGVRAALRLTLSISLGVLLLGIAGSFVFFRHISRPLRAMLDGVRRVGEGDLESRISMPTRNEFSILADAFNDMSHRIAVSQRELIAKERMDHELELAREIQQSLLPGAVSAPAGFEVGHYYRSANEVGGDYVDLVPAGADRIALAMADVSGKGVPGLVVMAMVKTLLQELVRASTPPVDVVRGLNRALQGSIHNNMFVTFFIAILDGRTGRVTMSNAGHNAALFFDGASGACRALKMAGPPLGLFAPEAFDGLVETHELEMRPGDTILQYTDGLNESPGAAGTQFGVERIVRTIERRSRSGATALVDALVEEEARFRGDNDQFDDITLLALRAHARSGVPA
jgi:serine phosphatase RsbU (regulator of sigma subunit)